MITRVFTAGNREVHPVKGTQLILGDVLSFEQVRVDGHDETTIHVADGSQIHSPFHEGRAENCTTC